MFRCLVLKTLLTTLLERFYFDDIFKTILPSPEENDAYFSTIVSRVLVTHMLFSADVVQWNIPHKFTKEMSKVVHRYLYYHVSLLFTIIYINRLHWVCYLRMRTNWRI